MSLGLPVEVQLQRSFTFGTGWKWLIGVASQKICFRGIESRYPTDKRLGAPGGLSEEEIFPRRQSNPDSPVVQPWLRHLNHIKSKQPCNISFSVYKTRFCTPEIYPCHYWLWGYHRDELPNITHCMNVRYVLVGHERVNGILFQCIVSIMWVLTIFLCGYVKYWGAGIPQSV
jgi:hypothetical protein